MGKRIKNLFFRCPGRRKRGGEERERNERRRLVVAYGKKTTFWKEIRAEKRRKGRVGEEKRLFFAIPAARFSSFFDPLQPSKVACEREGGSRDKDPPSSFCVVPSNPWGIKRRRGRRKKKTAPNSRRWRGKNAILRRERRRRICTEPLFRPLPSSFPISRSFPINFNAATTTTNFSFRGISSSGACAPPLLCRSREILFFSRLLYNRKLGAFLLPLLPLFSRIVNFYIRSPQPPQGD